MSIQPAIGDRYYFTWEELGKPTVPCDIAMPGLGYIFLDDADIHYALKTKGAAFYVRKSPALGEQHFVVVSRVWPA